MIQYRKVGGLHFVSAGAYGFSFHRKRRAAPIRVARLSRGMVAGAFLGAVALALAYGGMSVAMDHAEQQGRAARWMLTRSEGRVVHIKQVDLRFDACMAARGDGQRCRLQPRN